MLAAIVNLADPEALHLILERLAADGIPTAADSDSAYQQGVIDLLRLFGLVQLTESGSVPTDDTARWLIKSLAAHLTDNIPTAPWYDAEMLAAIEAARYRRHTNPTPVREVFAANAIIKATSNGHIYLLMQYDAEAGQFQLIGGKREIDDPDIAFTLLREIREELKCPEVSVPADLTLVPLGIPFEKITLSPTYGVVSSYHITFFHIQSMRFHPLTDALTVWIDLDHIRAGRLPDNRLISTLAIDVFGDQIKSLSDSLLNPVSIRND